MPLRRSVVTLAVILAIGIVAAGCGDDNDDSATSGQTAAPTSTAATGSTASGKSTGKSTDKSSGDASGDASTYQVAAALLQTLKNCIVASDRFSDFKQSIKAKERCQKTYDEAYPNRAKFKGGLAKAKKNCNEAANDIPDAKIKEQALKDCAGL